MEVASLYPRRGETAAVDGNSDSGVMEVEDGISKKSRSSQDVRRLGLSLHTAGGLGFDFRQVAASCFSVEG